MVLLSGSPSGSTTRCSTCGASARNAPPATARRRRSKRRLRPRAAPCSISGFTVMIAMAGMYLAGAATFTSFATGTIIVVAMAMVGSLTVLPAVLAWLGDRVEKGRIPIIGKRKRSRARSRGSGARSSTGCCGIRCISIALSAGFLLVLAIPALGMQTPVSGIDTLPRDLEVISTYDRIQAAFPGRQIPADVVVRDSGRARSGGPIGISTQVRREALASDVMSGPITSDVNPAGTVEVLSIPVAGRRHRRAVERAPSTSCAGTIDPGDALAGVAGTEADWSPASPRASRDFNTVMKSNIAARSSRSCSARRSCCCWSPSARS